MARLKICGIYSPTTRRKMPSKSAFRVCTRREEISCFPYLNRNENLDECDRKHDQVVSPCLDGTRCSARAGSAWSAGRLRSSWRGVSCDNVNLSSGIWADEQPTLGIESNTNRPEALLRTDRVVDILENVGRGGVVVWRCYWLPILERK